MKRRLLVFSTLFTLTASVSFAQQDKLITHFIFDKMSFNPAAAGINDGFCATTIYRNQWDKVNGAPNSAVLNVEGNFSRWLPMGGGISFYHDAIGFTRQNNVLLNLNYQRSMNPGTISVGLGIGIMNVGMNPDWVPPVTLVDPSLPTGYSDIKMDLNAGIYWKGAQDYYVGISSTHVNEPVLDDSTPGITTPVVTYNSARHYYLMGGKSFMNVFSNGGDIDGNVLIRTDAVKVSADINVRYMMDDLYYGGLTYRTSDAIAVMAGVRPFKLMNTNSPLSSFLVGYSYDITINKLASISRGSHEIMMRYCYYLPPIPIQTSKHPRWL